MELLGQCDTLVERLSEACMTIDPSFASRAHDPCTGPAILAEIDWVSARLIFAAGQDSAAPDTVPQRPEHAVDLSALRNAAQAAERPRAWFESNAFYLLHRAQQNLLAFYRDGPTDDIPYYRHEILVCGAARMENRIPAAKLLFKFADQPA